MAFVYSSLEVRWGSSSEVGLGVWWASDSLV